MAALGRPTCSSQEGISTANKQGNSSDSSTPSKGEETPTNPTRKNKRKMSEPRKRTDVCSSKRFCLEHRVEDMMYGEDDDDEDDMMMGVRELPPTSPEPSPSSDERNNSTGTGPSPSPVFRPGTASSCGQLNLGTSVPTIYPTPVITAVGGVPQYAFLPPGFFPHPGLLPPGLALPPTGLTTGATTTTTVANSVCVPPDSPDTTKNSTCANINTSKEESPASSVPSPSPSVGSGGQDSTCTGRGSRKQRKNYKNMTRERRIEANARERTRVHTISAAFESLRRAVPSYSYHQRLSKLAILRIACSYILSLSRLAEMDYSKDQSGLSFADCVDLCTQTIQSEGRAKRRQ